MEGGKKWGVWEGCVRVVGGGGDERERENMQCIIVQCKYVDDDPFPTHLLCICLCVWI